MSALKPCPFCGSENIQRAENGYGAFWTICDECGACTGEAGVRSQEEADARWNTRAALVDPVSGGSCDAALETSGDVGALMKLARFGDAMLKLHRNDGYPGDIDGGEAQETAEKCGVIEGRQMAERCGEFCTCAEIASPDDWPMHCFFVPDDVLAARATIDKAAEIST